MLRIVHIVIGVLLIGFYAIIAINGWSLGSSSNRHTLPPDQRGSYRNYNFGVFHTGFHGGK